jgi:hypothetical protein
MYTENHYNAARLAKSVATMRFESNAGVNTAGVQTYTIAAPRSGKKIVLRSMSGPQATGATGAATVTFKSDMDRDGTVETIGRLAATVAVQTAAWQRPAVGSLQPSTKALPLAVGGNGKSLIIVFTSANISAMLLEVGYQVVEDISRPTNAG